MRIVGTRIGTHAPSYASYKERTLGCFENIFPPGRVTLTRYDGHGGRVQGTFDDIEVGASAEPGMCNPFSAGTGTVVLSGAFDATQQ